MKIKTILIAAMLAVSGLAKAQVSKDAFEKAVDFVNCKSIEFSLKKSSTIEVTAKFQSNCICQDNPNFDIIKSSIPQTETKTIELSAEIDKIKTNEFKANLKEEFVITLLSEDIFANQIRYKKLFDFASKRKDDDAFTSLKKELKKDLTILLGVKSQISNSNQPISDTNKQAESPTLEEGESTSEQRSESKIEVKDWFEGLTFEIDVFSIIISLILSFFMINLILSSRKNSNEISNKHDNHSNKNIHENNSNNIINNHIRDLDKEIKTLRLEISEINKKINDFRKVPESILPIPETKLFQDIKQPELKMTTETFYLSTPNTDGSFNESSASPTYKEGASIYKFTKIENSRAKFQIDERETSVKFALTYPDKSIIPVCDSVNEYESKYTRIRTLNQGEAELQNGKWIVNKNQKAKIRYES